MYRTLLGVSKEFVLIGCVLRKRFVFILYFTHPHLFNENKLRTHTSKVRYFHVTLIPSVLSRYSISFFNENKLRTHTSKVRYISFQRNLQLKIHLSSYHPLGGSTPHN